MTHFSPSMNSRPVLINEESHNLLGLNSFTNKPAISKKTHSVAHNILNSKVTLSGISVVSTLGIIYSTVVLTPLLYKISDDCFDAEMKTQVDFNKCNQPYVSDLILYHSILAISALVIGFILQKLVEIPHSRVEPQNSKEMGSHLIKNSLQKKAVENFKAFIAYLQINYRYETLLLLGYVYNGIGIKVDDPSSFHAFLACSAGSIGVGSGLLGMYARTQWVAINKHWSNTDLDQQSLRTLVNLQLQTNFIKNHWKTMTITGISGAVFILTWMPQTITPAPIDAIARDLSIILLGKPLGQMITYQVDQKMSLSESLLRKKIGSVFALCLNFQLPLLTLSYAAYILPEQQIYKFAGLAVLGFTLGIKDQRYQSIPFGRQGQDVNYIHKTCFYKTVSRVGYFAKEYWKTAALISFAAVLEKFQFLNCDGPPTPLNFTCPIGLETSVYVAGNQVVVESSPIITAIIMGLTHYYARRFFKLMSRFTVGIPQRVAKSYIKMTDKHQLDLLVLIPYALLKSGKYVEEVQDFYTYNPIASIVLVSLTWATYKEQVNSRTILD